MTGKPPYFWITATAGVLLLACVPVVVHSLGAHGSAPRAYRGWSVDAGAAVPVVRLVDAQGPAAGRLQVGERIVAVNGDARVADIAAHFRSARPGDAYTLRVAGAPGPREVTLVLGARPQPWPMWLRVQFVMLACGYLGAGLLIGLLRPEERTARLFSAVCLVAGGTFLVAPTQMPPIPAGSMPFAEALLIAVLWIPCSVLPAAIYSAYLRFPPGIVAPRGWRRLGVVYWCAAALLLPFVAIDVLLDALGSAARLGFASAHPSFWSLGERFLMAFLFPYMAFASVGAMALLVRNYRAVATEDQRRRVQWFVWCNVVATVPLGGLFVAMTIALLRGRTLTGIEQVGGWFAVVNLLSLLSPLSLVYSLLKHDLLDIRLALRAGVQYVLARGLLRVVVLAPLLLLAAGVVADPNRTVRDIVVGQPHLVALAVLGAVGLRYQERLRAWVDRRFFRGAYDAQQILTGLVDEMKGQDSLAGVARLVAARVEEALHPRHVRVYWRDEATSFALGHSSGNLSATGLLSDVSGLIRLLEGSGEVRELSGAEAVEVGVPDSAIAVPIGGGAQRLSGFLLLGPRRSESAYTKEDRRLLAAIAAQLAIVQENAALKRRTASDARERQEVLARLEGSGVNLLKECPACGTCFDRDQETCGADGSALRLTLPVDRTIDGKYRLDRLLGRGGMGAVYEATDLRLGRRVAVKVMTGASFGNEDALRRFGREARASARLEHPNIVTVFDYGELQGSGAYLVMERLSGETLRASLSSLSNAEAAAVFGQMLEGVAAAHRAGVVHRDLKPENVFLAVDGKGQRTVKVLDFGLAKLTLADESGSLTAEGSVMGTLAYMSPEQLKGQPVDARTDVFAIGVMAAEALTGKNPFRGADTTQTVAAILGAPFSLEGDGAGVREMEAVLLRCLAKDREQRYGSVDELASRLVPAMSACPALRVLVDPVSLEAPTRARPASDVTS
jgi:hypothetical protein